MGLPGVDTLGVCRPCLDVLVPEEVRAQAHTLPSLGDTERPREGDLFLESLERRAVGFEGDSRGMVCS